MSQNLPSLNKVFQDLKAKGYYRQKPKRVSQTYENVLGTRLELVFEANPAQTPLVTERVLAEIDRLEKIYSRFNPASELNYWLEGENSKVSPDLYWLLKTSDYWRQTTKGAFHPAVDGFSTIWQQAVSNDQLPRREDLDPLLMWMKKPFAHPESDSSVKKLFPYGLNFNAIAKGRIVDLAILAASTLSEEVLLNIGGDLRHLGNSFIKVEVLNPLERADNAKPLFILNLKNLAIASSGSGKRPLKVAGKYYSHLIDPRTGCPVEVKQGATVIASDCATADALATAFSVMKPDESLELASSLSNVGCMVVDANGKIKTNAYFDAYR